MNTEKVIYPTTPSFSTDNKGNQYPLLYIVETDIYPFFEERVLEIFNKYNIDIDYKDDDTFSDWLYSSHEEGLFDNFSTTEIRDIFLLQWMTDVKAGSSDIQYAVIKKEVYDRKITIK